MWAWPPVWGRCWCQGSTAPRFYYDLPITALVWSSVAVLLLSWDRRPIRGALLAEAFALAASFTKWTTVPFLLCNVSGAAMTRVRQDGESPNG